MKRFSNAEKRLIIKLLKKEKSLSFIAKEFNVGKNTIFYYRKKLLGLKIKKVIINLSNERLVGEFIGIFAGDGYFQKDVRSYSYKIKIFFNKNEKNLVDYYYDVIYSIFGKFPRKYFSNSMITLELSSKQVIEFIKNYLRWDGKKSKTVFLVNPPESYSKNFIIGFIKGLIDSDGYVRKDRPEIYFGTVSQKLFQNFIQSLGILNIAYKTYFQITTSHSKFCKVRISGNEFYNFIHIISPEKAHGLTGI